MTDVESAGGPSRLTWRVAMAYVVVLIVAAVGAAAYLIRYWGKRAPNGYMSVLERLDDIGKQGGIKALLFAGAPIALGVCVLLGLVALFLLARRRIWALWATLVVGIGTIGVLWYGNQLLRTIEGRFYDKSPWVKLYKSAALPLGVVSALVVLVLLIALLYRPRRSAS